MEKGDGVIVLVAMFAAGTLALRRAYRPAALVGVGILGLIGYVVIPFTSRMSEARAEMAPRVGRQYFQRLGRRDASSVQFQWGLGVMIVGALLIIGAAFWQPQPGSRSLDA
jgi:hypothetical protein